MGSPMQFGDLRGILQYVPQFRGRTFVIAVDGLVANLSSVTWPAQPGCREVLVAVGVQVLDCAAR